MFLEIIGFLLSSLIAGVFLFAKLTGDIFPLCLKRSLNKLALSNWVKRLPQTLPIYNTTSPVTAKEAGILAGDGEWKLEQPSELQAHNEADEMLIHGVDDVGNCLVAKITRFFNNTSRVAIVLRRDGETFSVEMEGVSNGLEFSLGNFRLELIEPFRSWRVFYNGCMRNHELTSDTDVNLVHVTLNFLWKPLGYAKDFRKDLNISLLAHGMLYDGPFGQNFMNLKELIPNGYYQFGSLNGIAKINGDNDTQNSLYLYGYRTRQHYSGHQNRNMVEFFAMRDVNGDAFRLVSRNVGKNGTWIDGETSYASLNGYPVQEIDVEASCLENNSVIPKVFEVKDMKSTMRMEIWPKYESIKVGVSLDLLLLKMDINGASAHGIILRTPQISELKLIPAIPINPTLTKTKCSFKTTTKNFDFLSLESEWCCNVNLVGGKGASLAKLAGMSKSFKEFNTSPGFCVTAHLFRKMINEQALKQVFMKEDTTLEELCLEAIDIIKRDTPEGKLRPLIKSQLDAAFGEGRRKDLRFAIRSSGLLEDGSDLSCAGQNETFLGVDEDSICEKIVQCWASLFTFQSVSYRLNHGQPAVTEMGVVIQEMVDAVSAGVLFTADPRTGNPFEMLITANYGLGESVVSASCDPDCIVVGREKSIQSMKECGKHNLSIRSKTIGAKKTKVVLSQGGKSVVDENISDSDSNRLCLSDNSILELGWIASQIEKNLGQLKPVDVEWAITENGTIFILQCRPCTSLDVWTEFEIIHQFDTAIRTRIELFTRANTGEVMPLPMHACSIQSLNRNLDVGVQDRSRDRSNTPICAVVSRAIPIYCNTVFLTVIPTLYRVIDSEINANICCVDLTVFGRPVITKEVHKIALERYGAATGLTKLAGLIKVIKLVRSTAKELEKANENYGNWTFSLKKNVEVSARNIYDQVTQDLMIVHGVSDHHCSMSEGSSITLVFAFLAVSEGKKAEDWPPSLYEDVGRLLSAYTSVESAEMPTDMDELAEAILKYGGSSVDDFLLSKSTKEAMSWLASNNSLTQALEKFMEKHGHRSIAELDIGQDSWQTEPFLLMILLKNIIKNKIKNPSKGATIQSIAQHDEESLLNSLKTPLKSGTKMFLKFLLPHCRRMVIYRERTKSLMVKVLGQMKVAYALLGESMVKEQLIPDKGLIKHLTHHEMGLLIDKHHSTSSILYRALRRMRLYPTLAAMDFPEISVGIPKPLDNSKPLETCDEVKGTPVSAGRIVGTAKVCLNVEDASNQIEEGDILITKGTDIAWSPFFPMLGGVVTELGGLISHGAVVAREYSLPCIVGAVNATKIFQSGDQIVLDTSTGTISKIKM